LFGEARRWPHTKQYTYFRAGGLAGELRGAALRRLVGR
jgi:hypothetical protein